MLELAVLVAAAIIAGYLVAHRWIVVAPIGLWSLDIFGRDAGWWGHGLGDGWQYALVLGWAAGAIASLAGVALRRRRSRPRHPAT